MNKAVMACLIIATASGCSDDDNNGNNTPNLENVTETIEVHQLYIEEGTPIKISGNGKLIINE